jgi:hypothetical protein
MKKDVIERLPSFLGGLDGNLQSLYDLLLPDVFGELTRSQIEIIFNFWLGLVSSFFQARVCLLFGCLHTLLFMRKIRNPPSVLFYVIPEAGIQCFLDITKPTGPRFAPG